MNAIMMASGPTTLHMSDPDSNFKDDLVKSSVSFVIQNLCSTVPEFT